MYNPEKTHYVVATCILVKDGKFLIAKRAPTEKAFPNQWTVPGGTLEASDYKKKAVRHKLPVVQYLSLIHISEPTRPY